jgi:hypothetical protein
LTAVYGRVPAARSLSNAVILLMAAGVIVSLAWYAYARLVEVVYGV